MRILAISNHATMVGGGEYSFLDLVSHLPADWQVLTVAPREGDLSSTLFKKKVNTRIIPLPAIRPWNMFNILGSLHEYRNICRKYHPHLIYANGSRAAFYGGIVGRILNTPVIWHCRIAEPDVYLDGILTRLSSKIVTNSHATAKRFKPNSLSKIKVVYNGIDIHWLRHQIINKSELIQNDWKIILVVARISKWKRHDLVLSAFERIAGSDPKVHLVCLGSRDELEPDWWHYLQDRSRQSTFSSRIHWVGYVEDVRSWYRSAYMLVLASDNEPFGRVLVEAMACEVPVIAVKSGGVPEIVRHGKDGLLVGPCKVDEIADAMKIILDDRTMRDHIARNAKKRAEYFNLDNHVEKMIGVFEDTIKN